MTDFISKFFANLLALFVFFLLIPFMALMAAIFGLIFTAEFVGQKTKRALASPAVVLDMSRGVADFKEGEDAISHFLYGAAVPSVYDLCAPLLEVGAKNLRPILIITGSFDKSPESVSMAQVSEIRKAVLKYKLSGGKVLAYLQNPSFADYYLASAAEKIALNPFSDFSFKGLSATTAFFGNAFEKYGVKAEVVKTGNFKNAAEIFRRGNFSDDEKRHLTSLLKQMWTCSVREISISRNIPAKNLENIAENEAIFSASCAKELGLVDTLMYGDEFKKMLAGEYGLKNYPSGVMPLFKSRLLYNNFGEIAVVYMRGDIVEERQRGRINCIAADYYVRLFRKLRGNPAVKAVVIRLDSGGGDAYASELIRRELSLLAKEKPLLCSFGGLATSGAYWIATAADAIYADNQSITGSIGVFALGFCVDKLAANFGITFDTVKTNSAADILSVARPMSDFERLRLQSVVNGVYGRFVELVSKSRKISPPELANIADGRIFSGKEAKSLRLVDKIGTLYDAVSEAKLLAHADSMARVRQYPIRNVADELFYIGHSNAFPLIMHFLPSAYSKEMERLRHMLLKRGIYARLPFDIVFER